MAKFEEKTARAALAVCASSSSSVSSNAHTIIIIEYKVLLNAFADAGQQEAHEIRSTKVEDGPLKMKKIPCIRVAGCEVKNASR